MRRLHSLIPFILITISFTSCSNKRAVQIKKNVVLKLNYKPNKSYLYHTSMKAKSKVKMGMISYTANAINNIDYEISSQYKKGDTLSMTITIKDASIIIKTLTEQQNLSMANELKGKRINLKILRNGNIIYKDLPHTGDRNLQDILDNLSKSFAFIPDIPIGLNKSWKDSTQESTSVFTLSDILIKNKDTIAKITFTSKINKNTTTIRNNKEIETKIRGRGNGEILFSINRGIILYAKSTTKLEGKIYTKDGMDKEETIIPIHIDQTSTLKLRKVY